MFQRFARRSEKAAQGSTGSTTSHDLEKGQRQRPKWSIGILNDKETDEVPGSVLLLSNVNEYNAPLGLQNTPARTSSSSLPASPLPTSRSSIFSRKSKPVEKKRTEDGKIILDPQPSDAPNDPLNWPVLRRDLALFSLGFYSMIGGGMTPILAAGFGQVAGDLGVTVPQVALTTGLYMAGLGVGSVLLSPTAILFGKRPVYLGAAICFIITNVWCALSPSFVSLLLARIFMGLAVASVECLPSASIAEIYFLHEKAYRLGIYTLLLLGGKNLIPLVSASIIQSLGWRWVFWIVAIIVGFATVLLFFFVPETFWDRSPRPRTRRRRSIPRLSRLHSSSRSPIHTLDHETDSGTIAARRAAKKHAHFAETDAGAQTTPYHDASPEDVMSPSRFFPAQETPNSSSMPAEPQAAHTTDSQSKQSNEKTASGTDAQNTVRSPDTVDGLSPNELHNLNTTLSPTSITSHDSEFGSFMISPAGNQYTKTLEAMPPKSFAQQLRVFPGRINNDNWFKVALRPFILFAYPSILWSALVYALSVGWLIVLSESVSTLFENRSSYNFTPLQVGLIYISPFIGGVLGTAVAGKLSDVIVQYLARKNGGVYEPEFRLFMAVPIAMSTTIGLMGYGWSLAERDAWIVPTVFFGIISFGCSLGSTTAITFAVDSYRQYSGEALVTLNFSKNILHGLVWSLFFNTWLQADGSRLVFIVIGAIQLGCMLTTIPMYIYGKRARMWTVRANLMEKF